MNDSHRYYLIFPFTQMSNPAQTPIINSGSSTEVNLLNEDNNELYIHKRLAILINFVAPHTSPVFRSLKTKVGSLTIYTSVEMEPNRAWEPQWEGLDVVLQRNLMLKRSWSHPKGFIDAQFVHIPYDTIWLLLRDKPQVVLSTELGMRSLQALTYRLVNRSSRIILWLQLSEHTEQGRGWLRGIVRKLLIKMVDAIIVNGESGARYIRGFGVKEDQIFRVPKPTDKENFFSPDLYRDEKAEYCLLYVGQLIERKGLIPFLHSLVQWAIDHPKRTLEFKIVGDGILRSEINQFPVPVNLKLVVIGHQPYEQLRSLYYESGIFVFPTLADEWGRVVNEALVSGLPVLGSVYSQAVEELVEDGKSGWHFTPDESRDVYNAITRALNTPPEVLQKMRRLGQEKALSCNPDYVADSMLKAVSYVL